MKIFSCYLNGQQKTNMHCLSSLKAATLENTLAWRNNLTSSRLVRHGNAVWFAVWKLREKLTAVEEGQQRVFDVTLFQSAKMSPYCTSSFYRLERIIASAENPLSVSWGIQHGQSWQRLASKHGCSPRNTFLRGLSIRVLRRPPPTGGRSPPEKHGADHLATR